MKILTNEDVRRKKEKGERIDYNYFGEPYVTTKSDVIMGIILVLILTIPFLL